MLPEGVSREAAAMGPGLNKKTLGDCTMNNNIKKILIPTLALSFMLMLPARAVEPSTMTGQQQVLPSDIAFQIPVNNFCSPENSLDFSFQLSNTADTAADITMYLYKLDGSKFNAEGTAYREMGSTIVPGIPFTLKGRATGLYHINFGNHIRCNERAYLGRIVVNSGNASLLARGWVTMDGQIEPVTVNDNKKFDLSALDPAPDAVRPKE